MSSRPRRCKQRLEMGRRRRSVESAKSVSRQSCRPGVAGADRPRRSGLLERLALAISRCRSAKVPKAVSAVEQERAVLEETTAYAHPEKP
jgi:hypothetical protein